MGVISRPDVALDIGLVASDFPRIRAFYEGLLGLEHNGSIEVPWGTLHRFRFGTSLLKVIDPTDAARSSGQRGLDAQAGIRYLTFRIDNVEAVWQEALAAGVSVCRDIAAFGEGGVVGMVYDPDGNVVELIRFPTSS